MRRGIKFCAPDNIIYYTKYLIGKQDIKGFNVKMNNVFGMDKVDSYKRNRNVFRMIQKRVFHFKNIHLEVFV